MKALKLILFAMAFSAMVRDAEAQTGSDEYYVNIGVFGVHNNAIRYTARANKIGFNSQYAIRPSRKLYYVYLFQTPDKRKAYAFLIKLRAETEYKDAWLFLGHLGEEIPRAIRGLGARHDVGGLQRHRAARGGDRRPDGSGVH